MARATSDVRDRAFGQEYEPTPIDRLGVWLSARRMHRSVPGFEGQRVGDFGCGYHASFSRTLLDRAAAVVLVDVALADELKVHPRVTAIEGALPQALDGIESGSLDLVVCNSVLEHLWDPLEALRGFWRVMAPGATALVNVPSWRGKWFLEVAAFRLGVSPADEINDHKTYYDPRDLWPLLVRAGFLPQDIRCFRHKLRLNTFAVCRKRAPAREALE
jgi:SAM-dependent methyltransferase